MKTHLEVQDRWNTRAISRVSR